MTRIDVVKLILAIRKFHIQHPCRKLPYRTSLAYNAVRTHMMIEMGMSQEKLRSIVNDIYGGR